MTIFTKKPLNCNKNEKLSSQVRKSNKIAFQNRPKTTEHMCQVLADSDIFKPILIDMSSYPILPIHESFSIYPIDLEYKYKYEGLIGYVYLKRAAKILGSQVGFLGLIGNLDSPALRPSVSLFIFDEDIGEDETYKLVDIEDFNLIEEAEDYYCNFVFNYFEPNERLHIYLG